MTLPAYAQAQAASTHTPPFPSFARQEERIAVNCDRCAHVACPLIAVALRGRTPAEWGAGRPGPRCVYFHDDGTEVTQ